MPAGGADPLVVSMSKVHWQQPVICLRIAQATQICREAETYIDVWWWLHGRQSCVFRIWVFTDKRVWIPAQQGRLWGEENSWEKGSVLMYVHRYQDPSLKESCCSEGQGWINERLYHGIEGELGGNCLDFL